MRRSYYRCCCINEPVIFSHCVHLKLGSHFHALLKVSSDRDDIVTLRSQSLSCCQQMLQPNDKTKEPIDLAAAAVSQLATVRELLNIKATHEGELASFVSFAIAFPGVFLMLVDTYDVLKWVPAILSSPSNHLDPGPNPTCRLGFQSLLYPTAGWRPLHATSIRFYSLHASSIPVPQQFRFRFNQFTSGILYFFRSPRTGLFSVKMWKKFLAVNNFSGQWNEVRTTK